MSQQDEPLINVDLGDGPPNAVAAIVKAADQQAAMAALEAAGFPADTVDLLQGEEGRRVLDVAGSGHGLAGRAKRWVQAIWGGSGNETALYDAALERGDVVVAVGVSNDDEARSAASVLVQQGGDRVNRFSSSGGMQQMS